ncbi:MAG: hypothetical protein EAZ85_03775 [Bacteroidetes bacterium]|nr:MAG: hypothetical protein EAZ85_03775 [Bacteroidota bacterium]TAG85561.1 MAG: hypothetical protein EAZ20_14785 [Bacteroidota bacterium]
MKKKVFLNILFFLFLSYIYAQTKKEKNESVNYNPNYRYTSKQLQADFEVIKFVLEKAHPSLYWYTPKNIFQKKIDSTALLLNKSLTEREFYQLISPLIAQIHCGHTTIEPSVFYQNQGKRLPLDFMFKDGKAYISHNYTEQKEIQKGANVLSINGRPMFEILQKILPALASDAINEQGKWAILNDDFANYYDLLIESPEEFILTCQELGTEKITNYSITAKNDDFFKEYSKNYNQEMQQEKVLSFNILKKNQTAILTINSFLPLDIKNSKQNFSKFIKQTFKTIEKQKIDNLIIDLRNNMGGELLYVNQLFSYVIDKNYTFVDNILVSSDKKLPKLETNELTKSNVHNSKYVQQTDSGTFVVKEIFYPFLRTQEPKKKTFKGNIFMLIGKKTFSAAALCASLFYAYQRAVFIGEESGGGANGLTGGDFISIVLPQTNLQLEVPIERWSKKIPSYPYQNRGIIPQYIIEPDIEDILNGKDKVLEKTLELIEKNKK